jgi:hypothetical protein
MEMNRRKLLAGAAPLAAIAVVDCAGVQTPVPVPTPIPGTVISSVIDFIQAAVNIGARYVPTVETIAAVAASLFGPQWVTIVQVGSAAINALIQSLQNVLNVQPPPVQARLRGFMAANPGTPVVIGTIHGITVLGYR